MNSKLITAMTILAVAFCCVAMIPSEDADAASTVTITVNSTTGGTATGGGTFEEGDTVTLTATPSSGYEFVKWTFTGGSSYANPLSFDIQAPMLGQSVTYTANFQSTAPSTHTVYFQSGNSSYGSVSRSSITNVPDGASISVSGNRVTINGSVCTATPTTDTAQYDYSFTSWSNTSGTVTSDRTITANFSRSTNTYTVSFVSSDVSYGSVSRSTITSVPYGSSISVSGNQVTINGTTCTATPSPDTSEYDYSFTGWSNTSGSVTGNRTITANFSRIGTTVTINVTSGTGGTATGGGTFEEGDTVTLTATPDSGYRFVNWTFTGGSSYANPLSFEIQAPMLGQSVTYTANFELIPTTVITVTSGTGGTATGSGTYYLGDTVTLTATPDSGYRFVNWTSSGPGGSATHVGNPLIFDIQAPMLNQSVTYTANFELIPTLNVTVTSGTGGSATGGGTYYLGDTVTLTATPDRGYNFVNWTIPGGYNITENPYIFEVQEPMLNQSVTFTANFEEGQALTIIAVSSGNGTVTGSGTYYLGETVSLTATPSEGYTFNKWTFTGGSSYQNPYTFEVAEIMLGFTVTYTATFVEIQNLPDVWWDNGYINGSATIVFDFSGRNASYGHQMVIPILKFDGIKDDADGIDEFTATGEIIRISMAYKGNIVMTLTDADSTVHTYPAFQIGEWTQYLLKLDVQNGYLEWGGIKSPYRNTNLDFNFTNYNTIVEKRIVDFSNDLNDAAFNRIYHEDTGTGTSHPHFQVVTTDTYLDTYGVVMNDPVINIIDQFPDYDDLRLNLYSFAVYGDSLNINGYTMNMNGSNVRVYYTMHHDPIYDDQTHTQIVGYDDYNEIATSTTPNAKYVDLVLSNIFITWENIKHPNAADRMCYLTFVDANMTFRMGSFDPTDLTISFDGIWYFTTALWEPYQAYEKDYSWDYHHPFNLDRNGFILIFIAISVAVFVIMNIYFRPSFLDYLVVIGAGIIAYVMLGGI